MAHRLCFTMEALAELATHAGEAKRIKAKIQAVARGGAGDIRPLADGTGFRLRIGDIRVLFERTERDMIVTKIGPRGSVYGD